ncbi:uncharacterized protein LOC122633625 [Vespula pensylvanica]|uniref:uncharacterized protein LOC122633625 n=1 Tax=Vespula pensylvanica TaxID=30213 RepID=UPI001CBA30D2|nr:uncharacterized protein LOC122633625 [Vespula pensylvanica]
MVVKIRINLRCIVEHIHPSSSSSLSSSSYNLLHLNQVPLNGFSEGSEKDRERILGLQGCKVTTATATAAAIAAAIAAVAAAAAAAARIYSSYRFVAAVVVISTTMLDEHKKDEEVEEEEAWKSGDVEYGERGGGLPVVLILCSMYVSCVCTKVGSYW